MPFCKRENLAELSRKYGIPYPTLYWWVRAGRIVLPRDEPLQRARWSEPATYEILKRPRVNHVSDRCISARRKC